MGWVRIWAFHFFESIDENDVNSSNKSNEIKSKSFQDENMMNNIAESTEY